MTAPVSIRNAALAASAGTGKTFALSSRYLALLAAGADPAAIVFRPAADMRYVGQGFEIPVPLPGLELGDAVPLKAMCSRKWETPLTSGASCRVPTPT